MKLLIWTLFPLIFQSWDDGDALSSRSVTQVKKPAKIFSTGYFDGATSIKTFFRGSWGRTNDQSEICSFVEKKDSSRITRSLYRIAGYKYEAQKKDINWKFLIKVNGESSILVSQESSASRSGEVLMSVDGKVFLIDSNSEQNLQYVLSQRSC